jgi:DNA-binding beta-propeller fold protein YncE
LVQVVDNFAPFVRVGCVPNLPFLPFAFHFHVFTFFKMKVKHIIILLLCGLLGLQSCKKDDGPASAGNYTSGVFVVNEGPFGGTGSITWHNPETGETVQDVFAQANGGAVLGQFVQSLTLHNGKGYIVVNGANKVYVVDAVTFKYVDTIGGLALPRFLLPLDNNQALISQWGADGLTGSVLKVDLNTLQIVQAITTGKGPDKMIRQSDGLIVVANSGGFGVDSTVSILNLGNTAELFRLAVPGKNPGSLAVAPFAVGPFGPYTVVHCRGNYLDTNPAGWVGATAVAAGIGYTIPAYGDDLVAAPDGQTLFFAAGGKIYALDKDGLSARFDQTAYGLGCDPATGYLYCTDAKDFSSAGEVVVYKPNGERVGAFPAGVAPGEVVFVR